MSSLRLAVLSLSKRYHARSYLARGPSQSGVVQPKNLAGIFGFGAALLASPLIFGTLLADESQVLDVETSIQSDSETITDPDTGIAFPKTIRMTTKVSSPTLTLIGLGVRKVSFLGIKVYSIGFYADLDNPNLHFSQDMSVEDKLDRIVRTSACLAKIVPTRDTSFTHLRDAFVRAVSARMRLGVQSKDLTEEDVLQLGSPLRNLKTLFPNSPLKKHAPLDIFLTPPIEGRQRALIFRDLGGIESSWMSVEFMMHYFDWKSPPSPPLIRTLTENLVSMKK